jgi:hypothetical protein
MKTDIWHLPTDIPENGREILLFQESGLSHTKIFQDNRSFNHYVGLFQIVKWVYTKDIQEQSSKIERLESQVDRYKNAWKFLGMSLANIFVFEMECPEKLGKYIKHQYQEAEKILKKEITQAIDKKE